jgi:hypothetical protein
MVEILMQFTPNGAQEWSEPGRLCALASQHYVRDWLLGVNAAEVRHEIVETLR